MGFLEILHFASSERREGEGRNSHMGRGSNVVMVVVIVVNILTYLDDGFQ